jgi:hypothetical protein
MKGFLNFLFGMFIPKPKVEAKTEEQTLQAPRIEVGVNIPVLFGTRMIKNPIIAWWGDVQIVKTEAPTGGKKG